jgi:hypothetical protein
VNAPVLAPTGASTAPPHHRAVAALRRVLEASNPGTLAALRRAGWTSPAAAFYCVTAGVLDEHLPEAGRRRDALEARWAVVISAMATAHDLLDERVALGEAFAKANVAEMRVLRLLDAHDAQLADLVRNVVHQLVQKAQPFDPNDLADLVLTDGTERARDPRRRISRSFYRHAET